MNSPDTPGIPERIVTRSTSKIVAAACAHHGLAVTDPLVLDGIGVDLAGDVRASLIAWAKELSWIGRTPILHRHGWKSPIGALKLSKPGCRELARVIASAIGRPDAGPHLQAWAMINHKGAEHHQHTHGRVDASGVYYLDDGGTQTGFLAEPGREILIDPRRGRLALFSGWMPHRVPRIAEAERVTIAFNVL